MIPFVLLLLLQHSVNVHAGPLRHDNAAPHLNDHLSKRDTPVELVRYDGCDSTTEKPKIDAAWKEVQDFMNIDAISKGTVDFDSNGALDYLGASSVNKPRQGDINQLFKNFASLAQTSSTKRQLHIRCDDPAKLCATDPNASGRTAAYTSQKDDDSGLARINFCNAFFDRDLTSKAINDNKDKADDVKLNMGLYWKTATKTMAHELLHIDWVTGADKSQTIKHVKDLTIEFRMPKDPAGKANRKHKAYGPVYTKILAAYPKNVGDYVLTNAENLALYITSQYVASKLSNKYPWKPVGGTVDFQKPPTLWTTIFDTASDGTITLNSTSPFAAAFVDDSAVIQPSDDDNDNNDPPLVFDSFAPDSAYPSAYISSRSSWIASETDAPDPAYLEPDATVTAPSTSAASTSPPQNTAPVCTGSATKWAPRDPLASAISTFCNDAANQGVQDKNAGNIRRQYLSDNDVVVLTIDWPSGNPWKPSKDECTKQLGLIMDSCDADSNANPMNWKHGGYLTSGVAKYSILPQIDRGYQPGTCSFHLHEEEDFQGVDGPGTERTHQFYLRDDMKDGAGKTISTVPSDVGFGDGNSYTDHSFYAPLVMTPEAQGGDYIQFTIGSLSWKTSDSQGQGRCNVGDWDGDYTPVGRDMDCFLPC